ncbi:hypothetical protein, partial [Enterobacter asburiae]
MNLLFKTKPLISINHSRKIKSSLMDFTFIVLFFIIAFVGIKNPAPLPNHLYLTIHYLWLASPLPLSYISLRLIKIPSLISAYTVLIAFKLLEYISDIKLSLTGEVLS